jgi:hypothetical protein
MRHFKTSARMCRGKAKWRTLEVQEGASGCTE